MDKIVTTSNTALVARAPNRAAASSKNGSAQYMCAGWRYACNTAVAAISVTTNNAISASRRAGMATTLRTSIVRTGNSVTAVIAFDSHHCCHASANVDVVPYVTTITAPASPATHGATPTVMVRNATISRSVLSRPAKRRSATAASTERKTFTSSASSTNEVLNPLPRCGRKVPALAASRSHNQYRRGDRHSAAVTIAYGGNTSADPISGKRSHVPMLAPT